MGKPYLCTSMPNLRVRRLKGKRMLRDGDSSWNFTKLATVIAVVLLCLTPMSAAGQTGTRPDSSSVSTAPAAPSDDPAFAEFQLVTNGMKPPKAISAPDPKYPELPADAEDRGTVVMLIGVTAKGRVQPVRVLRSDEPA